NLRGQGRTRNIRDRAERLPVRPGSRPAPERTSTSGTERKRLHMTGITFNRTLGTIAAAGVAVAAPLAIGAGTASAAEHDWSGVAQCESGGNWSTNTGNGYYGGLQFNQ